MASEESNSQGSDNNDENRQSNWENRKIHKEKMHTLLDGYCIVYLKTSECHLDTCPFSHEVRIKLLKFKKLVTVSFYAF